MCDSNVSIAVNVSQHNGMNCVKTRSRNVADKQIRGVLSAEQDDGFVRLCVCNQWANWPNADLPTSFLSLTVRWCYNVITLVVLLVAIVTHLPPPSVSISTVQLLRIYLNFSFLRIAVHVSILVLKLCHLKVVYVMPTFKFL